MAKSSKGMLIEIGIKRLSLLKEKGLITEEIFSDAEELLIKSETVSYTHLTLPTNREV